MLRIVLLSSAGLLPVSPAAASGQDEFVNWETPHVAPLAMTPDGTRLLAVNTPDNRLEVFDLSGGSPVHVGAISVGLDPVSVRARTNGEAWVVNHVSDSLSVVDLVGANVVRTLATDDEPCDVVFAGTPQRAFVTCSQASTLLVFDPGDLEQPPLRIHVRGEEPRALAVGKGGAEIYVAICESGNGTTILNGGSVRPAHFPPDVVNDAGGPYGGANPPPNAGPAFEPALAPTLPAPPPVSLIVKRSSAGRWLDDNGADWTEWVSGSEAPASGRVVGWTLLDHDVAIVDTSTLAVRYADGLMNLNMAIAVHPPSGAVTVVGTQAHNEIRFEPNLRGTFVRSQLASFRTAPLGGTPPVRQGALDRAAATVIDLNPHLDGSAATVPVSEREKSLGDPRGIVWNGAGTRAYVTGMGSNNVVVLDQQGRRAGLAPTIEVGAGPTGIVLDEARAQLYVLAKFDSALSVVSIAKESEVARLPFFDPSPRAIRRGRRHLYDTHATSGTGAVACASCHIDARMDRLAWDLGDPAGEVKVVDDSQNLGPAPGHGHAFEDWHPMKGPMLTQTLQDIIGKEPHHWRGDRDGLEEFNPVFVSLLGDDEVLSAAEMQEFEDFLATIHFPPNPFRNFDNSLPTDLALPGHFRTGRFGQAGQPLPNGNALLGLQAFRPPSLIVVGSLACSTCHTRPSGAGTDHHLVGSTYEPFPLGPLGEHHLALTSSDGLTNRTIKVPHLRNLYERTGFSGLQPESTAGFGYVHDGSIGSLEILANEPLFLVSSDQATADLVAFMLAFSGDTHDLGPLNVLLEPPGPPSRATH
ncbi:MAG: hypothetical protein HOP15_15120, partial [Planctomycetes bacterium]|nr:hypothetical protein [Planctomycetota bacterium]